MKEMKKIIVSNANFSIMRSTRKIENAWKLNAETGVNNSVKCISETPSLSRHYVN